MAEMQAPEERAQESPDAPPAKPRVERGTRPRALSPAASPRSDTKAQATPDAAARNAPLPPVAIPGMAHWHYTVAALHRGMLITGRAELAWWHDGAQYEASLRVDAPPLPARVQRSIGTLHPQGLAPLRFSDRLRSEEAAHFDRERGRVVFSSQAAASPLHPGAQDRLSVLLQLAALLPARPQGWSAGDTLVVQTATTREAQDWRFTVEGPENLSLPGGVTAALKVTREPQREWDPRLELWFVRGADYGLVRLRLTPPNGEWLDMQWSGTDKG
ncbi:DUF3108 domain-containing protein [Ramlibacter henchirensis]|uniref:DUF3108 domain-containing protein n=1 Tax=Ramlibacter henchirensis TaxID=204072 RepID=A0A4Z0C5G0_9BURK|nr:DUF3108 domain-containing protein [Ramlibacter henchirensis]